MKILTLNTWQERGSWKERWEVILQGLADSRPTMVCFQELFNAQWAGHVQKQTGYASLLFPEEPSGLVVYSDLPVASWGVCTLTPSPLEDYGRYALWAKIRAGQHTFHLFNTHLSWQLEDGASRRRQLEELLALIASKASDGESILVGDLNAPPDSPEIRWFLKEGEFRDLFHELHPGVPGFTWDNRNVYAGAAHHKMPDRRIDQVLVRGSGPVAKHLVSCDLVFTKPRGDGVWASDHFGVLAEFS